MRATILALSALLLIVSSAYAIAIIERHEDAIIFMDQHIFQNIPHKHIAFLARDPFFYTHSPYTPQRYKNWQNRRLVQWPPDPAQL